MPSVYDTFEQLTFPSRVEWRDWLADNHATAPGIWVVYHHPKAATAGQPTYDEAVEEALCFGWIDARARRVDADRSRHVFVPRRANGNWSATNVARVAQLQAAGRMTPAGQATVDAAIADGSWARSAAAAALEEPDDLRAALDADPLARAGWDRIAPSTRKQLLIQLMSVKRPDTRTARVARMVGLSRERESQ